MTMTFTTTAEHNRGGYTLCEAVEPPQSGAALHRHPTYDETFIICEGHYDFQLDGKMLKLGPRGYGLCSEGHSSQLHLCRPESRPPAAHQFPRRYL
jgi:hypothetical protein